MLIYSFLLLVTFISFVMCASLNVSTSSNDINEGDNLTLTTKVSFLSNEKIFGIKWWHKNEYIAIFLEYSKELNISKEGKSLFADRISASFSDTEYLIQFTNLLVNDSITLKVELTYFINDNFFLYELAKSITIDVKVCAKECDAKTSKCIRISGVESCRCNDGYSWMDLTYNHSWTCKPNCLKTCDAIKAQCIVKFGIASCECKVEFGFGSGLAIDGNNSCSHYLVGEMPTQLKKGNCIALLPELDKEYLFSFDVRPNKFVVGWHSVMLFTEFLGIWFHENGKGQVYISPQLYGKSSESFISDAIESNIWSNIEISQLFNGFVYNYTIKINNKIVFSRIKQFVESFKYVKVYASDPSNNSQDGWIKNFMFKNGNSTGGKLHPIIIPPSGFSFKDLWSSFKTNNIYEWDLHENTTKIIYGEVNSRKESQDIDECNETYRCPWSNSECQNKFGSYSCNCKVGWIMGEDNASCIDIKECLTCSWNNSVCNYINSSYFCQCKSGWIIGRDNSSCVANCSEECDALTSKCVVTDGVPSCQCNDGYRKVTTNDNSISCREIEKKDKNSININSSSDYALVSIITPSILVPILLVVIILAVFWIGKRKKKNQPIWLNSDPYSFENYFESYHKLLTDEWEINPLNIMFGKKIGEGAFGNVFVAKITAKKIAKTNYARQLRDDLIDVKEDSTMNVAVKLLKDGANDSEYNDFVNEINQMKEIGYHKNIVNMIGCCTFTKYLCLVNEFMENGDLLQFLRNKRTKFVYPNDDSNGSYMYTHTNYKHAFEKKRLMQNENPLMEIEKLKPSDLLSFALQIASGMEYLSCIKLVHRDLAARNILVGANKIVKISDFGLTRKLNDDSNYTGQKNRRLPIKWMSVEAIFYRMFTSYSDVWSYGVVLFEIVTLGGTPYSSISNREILNLLKSGYRIKRPENCSQTMYDIMLHCWSEDPLKRPTFTELRKKFENLVSQGDLYISLDVNEESAYYNQDSSHSISLNTIDELQQE